MGVEMLVFIGVGAYVGNLLDKKYVQYAPYMTALCSVLGLVVSFYMIFKRLYMMSKEEEK